MSDTNAILQSDHPRDVQPRRRPPPSPQEIAARIRSADPCNGLVKVVAIGGATDVCYTVVHQALFGAGDFVDEIGCYDTLEAAETSALKYARQHHCLFAPSWSYDPKNGGRDAR